MCDMRRRLHVWAVDWVGLGLVGKRDGGGYMCVI